MILVQYAHNTYGLIASKGAFWTPWCSTFTTTVRLRDRRWAQVYREECLSKHVG